MGIISDLYAISTKAKPFHSETLDNLAENMHADDILRNDKLRRYYELPILKASSFALVDRVFFDSKYLEMLSPEELLAVGAHEFNHIIKRHGTERIIQTISPSMLVAFIAGVLIILTQRNLFTLLLVPIAFLVALIAFFYVNARWIRAQETDSDLCAVQFGEGKAMISALQKTEKLHPINREKLSYRLMPQTYPSLEQRIVDIRDAMKNQPSLSPKTH